MFIRAITRSTKNQSLLSLLRYTNYSSSLSPEPKNNAIESDSERLSKADKQPYTKKQGMVAAAFASLNMEATNLEIKTPFIDKQISEANTIDQLLRLCEGSGVSRRYALKVVSILAEWTSLEKIKLSEFENDPRFIKLCKVLTRTSVPKHVHSIETRNDDLSTILSVTADDEAAKLVGSITLPQMVKVMATLSFKKRRSTLLLRALSFNITRNTNKLDLKQSGDLLYSMANLNFFDENLLSKIANDICLQLETNTSKSAVIGSILTSIGFLRYKNPDLLDCLSDWVINNHLLCRPQDIFSLCMTLAVVNYLPPTSEQLFQIIMPQLTPSEAGKPSVWLEIVWSLVLMNQAKPEHISSVLEGNYLDKIDDQSTFSTKLKLLNIDAAAQYLMKDYSGPRIPPDSEIRRTELLTTKEKADLINSVVNSLKNLIQSDKFFQSGVNTGMGFSIDAVCCLDKKCRPVPLDADHSSGDVVRVAILTQSYHDMCRGKFEPTGINTLAINLLKAQGYKVLTIPYTEYKSSDKVIQRVQYLESKLKQLVK